MKYVCNFRINYACDRQVKFFRFVFFHCATCTLHFTCRVDIQNSTKIQYISFTDDRILCCFSFCPRHGPEQAQKEVQVPPDLLGIAEFMMPKLIFRLVQHLRDNFRTGTGSLQITTCRVQMCCI